MSGPSEEQAETFTFSQVQQILQMQENTITNFLKMNMELLQTKIDQVSRNLYKENRISQAGAYRCEKRCVRFKNICNVYGRQY